MNNKYIHGINTNQYQSKANQNNPNPLPNFNINNQRFSSDFLISPFKEEESPPSNPQKNLNLLINLNAQNISKNQEKPTEKSKTLMKSDLKDSNNIININSNSNNNINRINNNNINNDITVSNNNMDKLQELLESKKLINTLCSIKTSTSQNINYEEIKLLPNLFLDLQEALKKSNQNVQELKETIKEKINTEKKLKQKLKQIENENKAIIIENNLLKKENLEMKQKFNMNCDLQTQCDEKTNDNSKLRKMHGFFGSIEYSLTETKNIIQSMGTTIKYLFTGRVGVNDLSGPVGIYEVVGEQAKYGIDSLLYLLAYLSVNVGIVNLIPFPAFDGGHILFLIIEKIRRKPVSPNIEATITGIGFICLMLLMIYVTFHDVIRIFT